NFQENYHLRFIHPRTGEQTIGPENPFGYPTHYGFSGPHRSQTLWHNPNPPPIPPTLLLGYARGGAEAGKESFPQTDLQLFPGLHVVGLPPGQQFTHTHWPLGLNRTRSVVRMYWTKETDNASAAFFRELASMSIRDVLSEDRWAVEAGQRGLSGGAIETIQF